VLISTVLLSCSKQSATPTASLNLINAVPGSASLVTNFNGGSPIVWYKNALKLVYGTSNNTNLALTYQGDQKLAIYSYPDTTDHSTPLFNLDLPLQPGKIHTLFLTGTLTQPDTLFTTDVIPYYPATDSSMGIRFVNLSPGSSPVSINIAGMPNGSEVGSLAYKGITGFKKYPATAASASKYPVEFRDAATGTLLGSFDVTGINGLAGNTRRFRNFTLAFMGLPADPTTRKIILMDVFVAN
jgi:hypothetical protein